MKKFILSLLAIAGLVIGAATFTTASPAAVVTPVAVLTTAPPGPDNPYCNNSNVIACPVVACPEGFAPDPACVTACYTAYVNAVRAAELEACNSYEQGNAYWVLQVDAAAAAHSECVISTGGVLTEIIACEATLTAAITQATTQLIERRARIAANLERAKAVALGNCLTCMLSCCTVQEEE